MLGDGPEADDVGQETFIRFYKALDTFRGDSSVKTYLTRIAINLSLNTLKRRKRLRERHVRREDMREAELPTESMGIEESERVRLVREAVQQLDPKHRAIVVLRMLEGYSTKETAELLDLPQGTVLSRLARGMKKLEAVLKQYIYES